MKNNTQLTKSASLAKSACTDVAMLGPVLIPAAL